MKRPDLSMDLLTSLYRDAMDPEYAPAKQRKGRRGQRRGWPTMVVFLFVGLLFGMASHDSALQKPAAAKEREDLIAQLKRATPRNDELVAKSSKLGDDVAELQRRQLGPSSSALRSQLEGLDVATAATSVSGSAMVVEVDDAPANSLTAQSGRIVDVDLRQIVNGLWAAGAEAIAINGHRLGPMTAIRGAGQSITVNYRSLVRPYKITAIGNPASLQSRFQTSSGGSWLQFLRQNYDVIVKTSIEQDVSLNAVAVRARYAVWKESD